MIETWIIFSIFIFVSCLVWFIIIGNTATDDFDIKVAKVLFLVAVLSWTWPVALPIVAVYGIYKAVCNVFWKDSI